MKKLFSTLFGVVMLLSVAASGQSALTATTLSAAVTSTAETITIASATGWLTNSSSNKYLAVIDKEAMEVVSINGTTIKVARGKNSHADGHPNSAPVYFLDARYMLAGAPAGACTAVNLGVLPRPQLNSPALWDCINSAWTRLNHEGGVFSCDATGTGSQTCAPLVNTWKSQIYNGKSTLSSNAATITFPYAFTSTTSYFCVANDVTTRANPVQMVPASATTATITNTTGGSDVIQWICVGQ